MSTARNLVRFDDINAAEVGKEPGWVRPDDSVVIINPRFGQVVHVWNRDGDRVLFDGILRAESGGGVFLPVDSSGRIGLQQVWRPQTQDMQAWREAWPNVDVGTLGRLSWECPRGFADDSDADGKAAAVREAEEETGSVVVTASLLGQVCDNTACSPHLTAVQRGFIDLGRRSDAVQDPNEPLLKSLRYFTLDEVTAMIADGRLYCSYTLAAIGMHLLQR